MEHLGESRMSGHQERPKVKCKKCGQKFVPYRLLDRYCRGCERDV